MAEGVLGRALAGLLREVTGRAYVQLPVSMRAEADALASALNEGGETFRCVLVVAEAGATDPAWVVPANDLLAWRTTDDRVFVLLGGAVEPDSSFATSAVAYLTSAFPGSGGGTCTPAALASSSVREALSPARTDEGALEAFEDAAPWVLDLLGRGLRESPRANRTWEERVLEGWAAVVSDLHDEAVAARAGGRTLAARDAWELVRLAGFPRPSLGRPAIDPPPPAEEVDAAVLDKVSASWADFIDRYVRVGEVAVVLDRLSATSPIPGTARWRGLDWVEAARSAQRFSASAPQIGRRVFGRAGFGDPNATTARDDWLAVTAEELRDALEGDDQEPTFRPGAGFLRIGETGHPLLDTRQVVRDHVRRTKADRLVLDGMELEVAFPERSLVLEEEAGRDGETIVDSVALSLTPKTGTELQVASAGLRIVGSRLIVPVAGTLEVKSRASTTVRWTPTRRLKLELTVRDVVGGRPQASRKVEIVTRVIMPSPYWPTVVAPDAPDLPVSPAADVKFARPEGAAAMMPEESPELIIQRAGNNLLVAYDGRWDDALGELRGPSAFAYAGGPAEEAGCSGAPDFSKVVRLADDALLQLLDGSDPLDATVVRITDDAPLPTNPLRRTERREALGEPSREAREAPLGQYQTAVARALREGRPDQPGGAPGQGTGHEPSLDDGALGRGEGSLYQLVIPSGLGELPADIGFGPRPSAAQGAGPPWPGLGDGPSMSLQRSAAWQEFMAAAQLVAQAGLAGGVSDWLSAVDVAAVGAAVVRRYLRAHRALVEAAKGEQDKFWARYPFSVFLVNSARSPERGTLQAVFLSPMHPVRLGWLFGAQLHAEAFEQGSHLLSLMDGWNFPAMGQAPGPGGLPTSLVALPLDPGPDGDTASWGALVPTSQHGIVRPPLFGAGARLPWGGRSGLNESVVRQSLDDYLASHPFVSSMQVELRSAVEAPRSSEVDRAVLSWARRVGPALGGTLRVIDSVRRLGEPPTRNDLSDWQAGSSRGRFAWIVRHAETPLPGPVDLAFVENSAPFTFVVEGERSAPVAPLPIKRFPTAIAGSEESVDYHHAGRSQDLFGLEDLLSVVEPTAATMRVVTTSSAIQAEREVRWEVIGDINMEPAQMARVARSGGAQKQLWEWRPGWLAGGSGQAAVRGAHYILAKAPRSLVAGLENNLGLTGDQADELLVELGGRGVGLASLRRPGTTQEAEAAGQFFTARLLAGFDGCGASPSWLEQGCHAGLVPLDPIRGVMAGLGGGDAEDSRADLALVILRASAGDARIKIVPVECKHRRIGDGLPGWPSSADRGRAAAQALASSSRLRAFQAGLEASTVPGLVAAAGRLQALAMLIDLAMKFGPDEPDPAVRAQAVQAVLDGRARFEVGPGLVVWSVSGPNLSGAEPVRASLRDDGVAELIVAPAAMEPLVWSGASLAPRHLALRTDLDAFLAPLLRFGEGEQLFPTIRADLLEALGLGAESDATGDVGPVDAGNAEVSPLEGDAPDTGHGGQPGARDELPGKPAVTTARAETEVAATAPTEEAGSEAIASKNVDTPSEGEDIAGRREARADVFLGADASTRFSVVGELAASGQTVALDLDQPKALGVFGYMGSGKSYLLGTLIEGAAAPLPGLNVLRSPLSVVVFNYRRNAADRFELSSLAAPNDEPRDVERLASLYGATPGAVRDVHVLCLPGELGGREPEYAGATAAELRFKPSLLDVEDWELLMGEPGSDAVFARTIRTALQDLRRRGEITVDGVRDHLADRLQRGSLAAAELRLEAVERIVSEQDGIDFGEVLAPGRVLVIDLRQPMFNRDDAMKLILACSSQIAKQRTEFNKLVVFDEAHEYMTEAFGERFDARIRYMRHEGSSYVFATQDVGSVPVEIRRHLGTNFVFSLETRDNINDMAKAAPEFGSVSLQHLEPGTCYVTSAKSTGNLFRAPRLVRVRPRATAHGGKSRIFDS